MRISLYVGKGRMELRLSSSSDVNSYFWEMAVYSELYDLEMDKITLDQGLAKFSEMGCPANQKGALFNPSW